MKNIFCISTGFTLNTQRFVFEQPKEQAPIQIETVKEGAKDKGKQEEVEDKGKAAVGGASASLDKFDKEAKNKQDSISRDYERAKKETKGLPPEYLVGNPLFKTGSQVEIKKAVANLRSPNTMRIVTTAVDGAKFTITSNAGRIAGGYKFMAVNDQAGNKYFVAESVVKPSDTRVTERGTSTREYSDRVNNDLSAARETTIRAALESRYGGKATDVWNQRYASVMQNYHNDGDATILARMYSQDFGRNLNADVTSTLRKEEPKVVVAKKEKGQKPYIPDMNSVEARNAMNDFLGQPRQGPSKQASQDQFERGLSDMLSGNNRVEKQGKAMEASIREELKVKYGSNADRVWRIMYQPAMNDYLGQNGNTTRLSAQYKKDFPDRVFVAERTPPPAKSKKGKGARS